MNFPKPPQPPQPPPPPPPEFLFPHLYTVYYKNNSTKFTKDFQSTIYKQFIKTFISNSEKNLRSNLKCLKVNSKTLLSLASRNHAINSPKGTSDTALPQSNKTEHHVIRIPSLPSIERSTLSSTRTVFVTQRDLNVSSDNNYNLYRPMFTSSTFYLINIFLFVVCVITLLLFIVMITLMSRRCNRKKLKTTKSGVSSASSSASSISFIACYTTSDSSLHSLRSLNHMDSNGKFNLDTNLQKSIQQHQTGLKTSLSNLKKKTFKTKPRSMANSPSKYYTITDSYFEKNFQLRKPTNKPLDIKSLCFAEMNSTNEYEDIIPDNFFQTNNSSFKCFNYPRAEYLPPNNQNQYRLNPVYHQSGFITSNNEFIRPGDLSSMNVYTLPKTSFENYYSIDHKSVYLESTNLRSAESYDSNDNIDTRNFVLTDASISNNEQTTDRRKFPRTNPMCRNLNYYAVKFNQSDELSNEESVISKL